MPGIRLLNGGCSSAGRAPALQAGGHRFESVHLHHRQSKTLPVDRRSAAAPRGTTGTARRLAGVGRRLAKIARPAAGDRGGG